MKKTMIAAVGLCGLLFAGAANAAVATPDTAPANWCCSGLFANLIDTGCRLGGRAHNGILWIPRTGAP